MHKRRGAHAKPKCSIYQKSGISQNQFCEENNLLKYQQPDKKREPIFYTLLATAELKGLEPKSWLKELLEKIPDHPMNRLEELLPGNWESPRQDTDAA